MKRKSIWFDIGMLQPHVDKSKVNDYLMSVKNSNLIGDMNTQFNKFNGNARLKFTFTDKINNLKHELIMEGVKFAKNVIISLLEKLGIIKVKCKVTDIKVDGKSPSEFIKNINYESIEKL